MYTGQSPRWLNKLERYLGWIAIPQIAIIFVTLQALGFLMVLADPRWILRLALIPDAVLHGELWRLITFLALPLSMSFLWVIFALWFIYFILNLLEAEWGEFKTTFYVLISIVVMIAFSFITGFPITDVREFESTLFLAAAAVAPEMEILLFLVIPVKMKWLAWFTIALVLWQFAASDWLSRFYLLAIYSNYLIFFGPSYLSQARQFVRRQRFKSKFR